MRKGGGNGDGDISFKKVAVRKGSQEGGGLRALGLTWRDSSQWFQLTGGVNITDKCGIRCLEPGVGEGGSQHSGRATPASSLGTGI